jgi:selenocysteine-specific elongation factor
MKFSNFDAVVDSWPLPAQSTIRGFLVIAGRETPVTVYRYSEEGNEVLLSQYFVRIHTGEPLSLSWKNSFKILDRRRGKILLKGRVLLPFDGEIKQKEIKKRLELLHGLLGDEKEMISANSRARGVKGLTEKELIEFSALTKDTLFKLSRQLEGEGKIRILSFSPLLLLSQDSFDFLCKRILAYLTEFHEKHPEDFGVSPEKIQKRFGLPQRVLTLALKHLNRIGQIKEDEATVSLKDFCPLPSPEEEKLLRDMEAMYIEGELRSVSQGEMQKRFGLSKKKIERMMSFLVERRKIVLGKDGFLLHSKWLDEVIKEVRSSGEKELSVSDFKQMTGLTRKYAIPLLELLDQIGVTRRQGSIREILREKDNKGNL